MGIREMVAKSLERTNRWDVLNGKKTRRFVTPFNPKTPTMDDALNEGGAVNQMPLDRVHPNQDQDAAIKYGATTQNPVTGGGATRPRIVPNQPVNPNVQPNVRTEVETIAPEETLSPIEKRAQSLYDERTRLQTEPVKDEDSTLGNFWNGAQNGARIGLATGDLGFTIGALAGGGIRGLFDKKADEKKKRKEDILKNKADIVEFEKEVDQKIEREGKIIGNNQKSLDYMRSANKPFYDSITADDQITQEEADEAAKRGFGKIVPYDSRQFKDKEVGGKTLSAPTKGAPNYLPNPTVPVDTQKVPRDTTIKTDNGEVTLPLLPNQAATTIVGIQQANAQRQQQAAQFVQKREDDLRDKEYKDKKEQTDDLRSWERRQLDAQAKKARASTMLGTLTKQREQLVKDEADTKDVDKLITAAEGDISEAEILMKEKKPTGTVREKPVQPKTSKGGKNDNIGTTDNYREALKKVRGF